ncbi:MAG TPA: VWA domain-containing protein [Thiotrichaceae bacterium]|nr:VWA domain-containing protein [Thiotrichaceae bacterium]
MRYLTFLSIIFTTFLVSAIPKTILADQIQVNTALATPVMLADKKQTAYLQVGLMGFRLQKEEVAPINVALVIDKSGSMQGKKIRRAKDAAIMAVDRIRADDIIAVVTYNNNAEILLPATKATDKESLKTAIKRLRAGGQTALYDGVKKGAQEIRKFLHRNRVNRMILVSDGRANVGPDSPTELGLLGASLSKEGIAVTTIGLGLGYNEDLMTQLAGKSNGNHVFAENAKDLARFFDYELSDILAVIAQEVKVTITCADGIRPVRSLGKEAEIQGQQVQIALNQLYSEHENKLLLEIEVPPTQAGQNLKIADVKVVYRNMVTDSTVRLNSQAVATFTTSPQQVEKNTHLDVMIAALEQLALIKNDLAITLRDLGKIKEAQQVLLENAALLADHAKKYDSDALKKLSEINRNDAINLNNWLRHRKIMRGHNYSGQNYQRY